MKEPLQIACLGGLFTLPEEVFLSLKRTALSGTVYVRQSDDTVVIAPSPLADGRKRQLNRQYRAITFKSATRLAVVRMGESFLLMATRWRSRPADAAAAVRAERK
jgi:hypothetical protein